MKRTILLILIALISATSAWAVTIGIVPYDGSYGVNMASVHYRGTVEGFESSINNDPEAESKERDLPWVTGEAFFSEGETFYDSGKSRTTYCDNNMVAVGGVYEVGSGESGKQVNIRVNCSGGFYFRSLSHPNSIRPFELIVVPRYMDSYDSNGEWIIGGWKDYTKTGTPKLINDSFNNQNVPISYTFDSHTEDRRIWFDIVLVLPLSSAPVSNSNYIEAYNRRYALTPADDYTAIVSIEVSWEGATPQTITIPFSGYYSGVTDSGMDKDASQSVNLQVSTTSAASNLTISNTGNPRVEIGKINFMQEVTEDMKFTGEEKWVSDFGLIGHTEYLWQRTFHDDDYVRIFLSSSNDATDPTPKEFELVHTSVLNGQVPPTNYNRIGFDIYVQGDEGDGSGTGETVGIVVGNYLRKFDGTDSVDSSGDLSNGIIPIRHVDESTHIGLSEYFEYEGTMSVQIDTPVTTMVPGSYIGTVYVHVVTDDNRTRQGGDEWRRESE